jgi:hypothetical protein
LSERSTKHSARKHGKTWPDRGSTSGHARRLYLEYPLLPAAVIARILGVSRQAINEYVEDLKERREKLSKDAIAKLKRKEGLSL